MNFEDLTHDICRLVDDNNRWSSVLEIPQGDGFLNISSALQDDFSSAPIGAINQPDMFLLESLLPSTDSIRNYSMESSHGQN